VNLFDVVAGFCAAFALVYLFWAMLRPEDF
jgi:membrane-associated phospholipid phosphatase